MYTTLKLCLLVASATCMNLYSATHTIKSPIISILNAYDWQYGGDAVMTSKFARLTPSAFNKYGWLRSSIPLPGRAWEITVELKIHNSPNNLGGDGFAIHLLDYKKEDEAFEDVFKTNDFFGIKASRKGISVVIDTFDNDNKADNPSVFVLDNLSGADVKYNHNNDYIDDIIRSSQSRYRCKFDLRNKKYKTTITVKYYNQRIYVYTSGNGESPVNAAPQKFCLLVKTSKEFGNPPFLAFSSITGGSAFDNHDILSVTTKYVKGSLKDTAKQDVEEVLDLKVKSLKKKSWFTPSIHIRRLFWLTMTLSGVGLFLEAAWEISQINYLKKDQINAFYLCDMINKILPVPFYLELVIFAFFLFRRHIYIIFLLAFPSVYRIYKLYKGDYKLSPTDFEYSNSKAGYKYTIVLYVSSFIYVAFTFWSVGRLISF